MSGVLDANGNVVNARLLVRVLHDAITVPAAAVQLGRRGAYVYVVRQDAKGQDEAELRLVTPGISAGGLTVIEKGLASGEKVVVDGLDRLREGIAVRVAATTETPRAESVDAAPENGANASLSAPGVSPSADALPPAAPASGTGSAP